MLESRRTFLKCMVGGLVATGIALPTARAAGANTAGSNSLLERYFKTSHTKDFITGLVTATPSRFARLLCHLTGELVGPVFPLTDEWWEPESDGRSLRGFSIHWNESAATIAGVAVFRDPLCRMGDLHTLGRFGPAIRRGGICLLPGDVLNVHGLELA